MEKHCKPTAAKGVFPWPHRNMRQVAYDTWLRLPAKGKGKFLDWLATYHG